MKQTSCRRCWPAEEVPARTKASGADQRRPMWIWSSGSVIDIAISPAAGPRFPPSSAMSGVPILSASHSLRRGVCRKRSRQWRTAMRSTARWSGVRSTRSSFRRARSLAPSCAGVDVMIATHQSAGSRQADRDRGFDSMEVYLRCGSKGCSSQVLPSCNSQGVEAVLLSLLFKG